MDPFTLAILATSALISGFSAYQSYQASEEALSDQRYAQRRAEQKQKEADDKAEKQRLEALAQNQTATDYGSIWGVKNTNFADAAQKLSAGTGSFDTDEDEDNPFYTRGLL